MFQCLISAGLSQQALARQVNRKRRGQVGEASKPQSWGSIPTLAGQQEPAFMQHVGALSRATNPRLPRSVGTRQRSFPSLSLHCLVYEISITNLILTLTQIPAQFLWAR